jgi:hypothetical protein
MVILLVFSLIEEEFVNFTTTKVSSAIVMRRNENYQYIKERERMKKI